MKQHPLLGLIHDELTQQFKPVKMLIQDDSDQHNGHEAVRDHDYDSGPSHLYIVIVSSYFQGMPHVQRHRAIYKALEKWMPFPLHALRLKLQSPDEFQITSKSV